MDRWTDMGLSGGVWRGLLRADEAPGRVSLVHQGARIATAELAPAGPGEWHVTARLPAEVLNAGAAAVMLVGDEATGDEPVDPGALRLATLPLIAGEAAGEDLRAELALLRAELDLVKRELRRVASGE